MELLNRYKNELLQVVLEAGLQRSEIEVASNQNVFSLSFIKGHLTFEVMQSPDSYDGFKCRWRRFTPNRSYYRPPLAEKPTFGEVLREMSDRRRNSEGWFPEFTWLKFDDVKVRCQEWIESDVRRAMAENSIPDLWAFASSLPGELGNGQNVETRDSEPFDAKQRPLIKQCIANFRASVVREFAPRDDQLEVIDEKLSYLTDAVDRLSQFDWKAVALSTVVSIASALTLDTSKGRELWRLFVDSFRILGNLISP